MEKILNDEVVQDILSMRLPITADFQRCSFIIPNGMYLKMQEHYEAYKFLVVEELVPCIPDAEDLLSDLGYIRYSWIGYVTLPVKEPTQEQYKSLEYILYYIKNYRDDISIQLHNQPKVFKMYDLGDVTTILNKIKKYYKTGELN